MKPKKGMTAARIVKKLKEDKNHYEHLSECNLRNRNQAGYEACEHKRLYIEVLLSEIAER
jgi:hypothetical protein